MTKNIGESGREFDQVITQLGMIVAAKRKYVRVCAARAL